MVRGHLAFWAPALFVWSVWAQEGSAPLAFDVAAIKMNKSGPGNTSTNRRPSGLFAVRNNTVRAMILYAYRIPAYQVAGGPSWLDADRYDIDARGNFDTGPDQVRAMMRALLASRFQLKVHRETKEVRTYLLSVALGGHKLKEVPDADASGFN